MQIAKREYESGNLCIDTYIHLSHLWKVKNNSFGFHNIFDNFFFIYSGSQYSVGQTILCERYRKIGFFGWYPKPPGLWFSRLCQHFPDSPVSSCPCIVLS